ncbi:conserved hypothetical protein [Shewanella sp. W3-18-1]|uniref:AAA family ATPase n=1 Tax=Shewanella sp. (strain W3-18-1) TaxID=351745 RepID=UPI00005FC2FB|nr:AAA family ATPase [Shewanella sp. W3-18-1]ABM23830.1 conserved hypothetical protein [Shewanella sp. W3-18-1]
MQKIKVEGLKSLRDSGDFELKKINILVGNNSSGKSTFLRIFPLLRQSVEKKTRGPILWNGLYIDFGSFDTAIHKKFFNGEVKNEDELFFTFQLSYNRKKYHHSFINEEPVELICKIGMMRSNSGLSCYTASYQVKMYNHTIFFKFDEDGVITDISSDRLSWPLKKHDLKYQITDTDNLLPILISPSSGLVDAKGKQISTALFNQVVQLFKNYSGSSSSNKLQAMATRFLRNSVNDNNKLALLRKMNSTAKWEKETLSWDVNSKKFRFISGLADLYYLIENSANINDSMTNELLGVRYIAPLRTSTARYYRHQDLSIDELDHRGDNIGMFISNITGKWREELNKWTKSEFGFVINVDLNSNHISINLQYADSDLSDNISDMGFGFSQVLPIIIQLWAVSSGYENSKRSRKINSYIFAIEQPELHLHPKMQASLSIVFINAIELANNNGIELKLIIETHSESIISKMGNLISKGKIANDMIGVSLFEQDRESRETKIISANFDQNGFLNNWPLGFFDY